MSASRTEVDFLDGSPLQLSNIGRVAGHYGRLPSIASQSPSMSNGLDSKRNATSMEPTPTRNGIANSHESQREPVKSMRRAQQPSSLGFVGSTQGLQVGHSSADIPSALRIGLHDRYEAQYVDNTDLDLDAGSDYAVDETQHRHRHPTALTPGSKQVSNHNGAREAEFTDGLATRSQKPSGAHPGPLTSHPVFFGQEIENDNTAPFVTTRRNPDDAHDRPQRPTTPTPAHEQHISYNSEQTSEDIEPLMPRPLNISYAHATRPSKPDSAHKRPQAQRKDSFHQRIHTWIKNCKTPSVHGRDGDSRRSNSSKDKDTRAARPTISSPQLVRHWTPAHGLANPISQEPLQDQRPRSNRARESRSVSRPAFRPAISSPTLVGHWASAHNLSEVNVPSSSRGRDSRAPRPTISAPRLVGHWTSAQSLPPPRSIPLSLPALPTSSLQRPRRPSTSTSSLSSSKHLGYGSYNPSPPPPRQPSFLERVSEAIEQGFVNAGFKSASSFKVNGVVKSPSNIDLAHYGLETGYGLGGQIGVGAGAGRPSTEQAGMRMGPGVYILQAQAPAPAPAHSLAPSPLNIEKRPQRPRRPSRKDTWEGNSSEGEGEGEGRSANFEPVYGDQGQVLAYKLSRQNMSSSESRRGLRTTRPRLDTRSSDVALPVGSVERPRPVGVIYPPLPPSYPSPPPPSYPSPPPSPPATLPSMFPSEYGYGYGYGIEHGDTANRSLSSHSSIDSLFLYDGKGKGNIHPSSSTSFFVTNFGQGQALAKDLDWESGASDSESGSERGYAPSVTSWDSDSDRSLFLYDGKGKAKVGNNRPGSSSSFFTSEFAMSRVELLAGDRDAQSECMSRSDMSDWEWRQHVPRSPSSVGMPSHSHWEQEADGEEEAEQRIKLCESPAAMSYEPERAQEQGYLLPLELLSPILESGNSFPLADARNELPSQILQGQFRSVDGHVGGVYPQEGTGIAGSWEEAGRGLRMEELPTHTRILSKKKGSTHLK